MSKRKKVSVIGKLNLELEVIEALTDAQQSFFTAYDEYKDNHLLLGYPGTGKTFLSLYKAFEEVLAKKKEGIVLVRSAVPTRDVGFLPGNLEEKGEIYELPYRQITNELFGRGDAYDILKKHGVVRFLTTSYVRGITLDGVVVIADEFQNMTAHEADSIITRLGKNSKILYCGDFMQTDLVRNNDRNIHRFVSVIEDMPDWFNVTEFGMNDIVRSGLVKDYIVTKVHKYTEGY